MSVPHCPLPTQTIPTVGCCLPLASSRCKQKSSCMCCKYVRKRFGQTEISLWINCLLQLSIYENSCPQLEKCGRIPPQINPLSAFCSHPSVFQASTPSVKKLYYFKSTVTNLWIKTSFSLANVTSHSSRNLPLLIFPNLMVLTGLLNMLQGCALDFTPGSVEIHSHCSKMSALPVSDESLLSDLLLIHCPHSWWHVGGLSALKIFFGQFHL